VGAAFGPKPAQDLWQEVCHDGRSDLSSIAPRRSGDIRRRRCAWTDGSVRGRALTDVDHRGTSLVSQFTCTVISDGPLPLSDPAAIFVGSTAGDVTKALADNFLPTDQVVLEQNALVVDTGRDMVLFDNGMGTAKIFGPTTGPCARPGSNPRTSPRSALRTPTSIIAGGR
jgi:hypothetical protein